MATAVIMPRQGQSVESCVIGKWHKKVGDKISVGDALFTYETDKATFDEEAKAEGVLLAVFYEEGDDVDCLKTVCVIGKEGESFDSEGLGIRDKGLEIKNEELRIKNEELGDDRLTPNYSLLTTNSVITPPSTDSSQLKVSPRARALIAKTGADVSRAAATGANGRIMEADIQRVLDLGRTEARTKADTLSQTNTAPISQGTDFEEVKLTNMRRVIAKAMHTSLTEMAQLTHHTSFDASDVLNFRKKLKTMEGCEHLAKITITDIIIYAVSRVLPKHRSLNAHFLGDKMALFNNTHIGIAVDTPRGLLVPTLFCADTLEITDIADATKVLFDKCKQGSIEPDSLKGASFTISNLGTMGIEMFTPVINPPQTGILGVCSVIERTKDGGKFYPAMGLSLTYDHRALDGADASRFLKDLVTYLEDFTFQLGIRN